MAKQNQPQSSDSAGGNGKRGLFSLLDGFPANGVVVLGLLLVLLGGILPDCRTARARGVVAELERANALYELDINHFREQQDEQRRMEKSANPLQPPNPVNEQLRLKALQDRRTQLKQQHRIDILRRETLDTRVSALGSRSHLVLEMLGNFFLVLGLLSMVVGASGTKQKVYLVILVVILLHALSGFAFDLNANARQGSVSNITLPSPPIRNPSP